MLATTPNGELRVLSDAAIAQEDRLSAGPRIHRATPAHPTPWRVRCLVVFPQKPVTTIRFDGNSEDIAKIVSAPHAGTSFNHDGTAFKSYVRPTSSESYNANVVDYAARENNVAEYQKNVQSGKWTRFVNGR